MQKNIILDDVILHSNRSCCNDEVCYYVHKYRNGQGSNSDVANEIDKLISDLEEHEQKMKENLEELESSSA